MNIAIPTNSEDTTIKLNKAYVDYLVGAGFTPVLIPQSPLKMEAYADMCDGLLLPGGKDIDPMAYGLDNDSSFYADPAKDKFERDLFRSFLSRKKPVFGICRGLQLIGYEFIVEHLKQQTDGLVLVQHIDDHDRNNGLHVARHNPTHFVYARHRYLYGANEKGWTKQPVNSMHHQYLHCNISETKVRNNIVVVDGMIITACTRVGIPAKTMGVVVEGLAIPTWNTAAVQWHPEELKDFALIQHFFSEGAGGWQAAGPSSTDSSTKLASGSN